MNTVQAKVRNLRIAPRKVRLASSPLRGLSVNEALAQLQLAKSRSTLPLIKLLKSATANAKNKNIDTSRLMIQSITVQQGPKLKRQLPRARGRATLLLKKMSHVTVVLSESDKVSPPRFNIYEVKKAKSRRLEKAEVSKPKFKEEEKTGTKTRAGILQRIFRRKAV